MPVGIFYPQIVLEPPEDPERTRLVDSKDMIAFWKLNDLNDSWFNTFTLTNIGSVLFVRGLFDKASEFNGTTQDLERAHSSILQPKNDNFTIVLSFRALDDQPNIGQMEITRKLTGNNGYMIRINDATGIVRIRIGDGTTTHDAVGTKNHFDGQWHTIIMDINRDGDTLNLFIDDPDTAEGTVDITGLGSILGASILRISNDNAFGFKGSVDSYRMYKRRMTGAERKTIMRNAKRYRIGTEERTGQLILAQQEDSRFSMNFVGEDEWKEKYRIGSEICVLHDIVSMDKVRIIWNFQATLDDESIHENDLVKQAGTDDFQTGGGIKFDGSTYYEVADDASQTFNNEFSISGELTLPASDGSLHEVIVKGVGTDFSLVLRVVDNLSDEFRSHFRIGGVTKSIPFTYTPGTKFKFAVTWNKAVNEMKLYINGVQEGATVTTSGDMERTVIATAVGAAVNGGNKLLNNSIINNLTLWERTLTAAEVSDINSLTRPEQNCLFDGVVMQKPIKRMAHLPFALSAKDFLFDRLVSEDVTLQFAEKTDLGTMMKRIVARTSLKDFFDTTNVLDVNKFTEGKYFIRTKIVEAFKFITDSAHTTFYSIRRGTNRYLHHHPVMNVTSGLSITTSNIVKQGKSKNPLFYSFTEDLFNQSNIIQVEGGHEFTIEEQETFDNATLQPSDTLYYGLKATPEFIKYGRLETKVKKVGTPGFDLTIQLREDKGGDPAGPEVPALATVQIPEEDITTTSTLIAVDFDVILDTGKTYWLVYFKGGDATNRYEFSDDGGAGSNMETSPTDAVWTPVGFTFVYNWSNKLKVISQTKDSVAVKLFNIRKITVTDPEITKLATARQLARGILERLSKVQKLLQNIVVKDITRLPIPGRTVQFTDSLTGFDEAMELQKITIPFLSGRNGEIRRPVIEVGDKVQDAQKLLQNMLAELRREIEKEEPVVTTTSAFAESIRLGLIITGKHLTAVKNTQKLGIKTTVSAGDPPANIFILKANHIWDADDTGGDLDNKYSQGVIDADDL